jgi:hypothetical protein
MENNTALVVKQDGKVYAFNMPEKPHVDNGKWHILYPLEVKKAIDSAVLCKDQVQAMSFMPDSIELDIDHPYVIPGLTFEVKKKLIDENLCDCGIDSLCSRELAVLSISKKCPKCCPMREVEEKTEKQEPEDFSAWAQIYMNFNPNEGYLMFAARMSEQFTITRKK